MRISLRLILIASVAACAPMLPEAPPVRPTPAPAPVRPSAPTPAAPTPAPADQAGFEGWKQGFLARHGGVRRDAYARELAGLTPDPSVIRLDGNQPEFSRPAGAYIQSAVSATRIAQGRQRTDRVPWDVVQRFGVPAEILVSIWGNESSFGAVQGDYDVIRSLATLAFDGRRRDWAEAQLKDALDIVVDGRRDRAGLKGSWAGAMGQTQFMPDNYLRLGVDQSGDGKVDIWGSDADSLASAANLLAQAGWKRGQAWGYEVVLPSGFDYAEAEGPRHDWRYWAGRGVTLARGGAPTDAEALEEATILLPQGARGPAFLALPNHYVIRRYNNSVSYALAIGLTADGIAGKPGLVATWPDDAPLSRDQRIGAQRALTALGYDTQGVDGVIGANTRAALRRWQIATGRLADGYLTADLADELIRRAD
ncbi:MULTISPECIES: lytic murein transglycosylase [unclassified Brevundimonas]|uniref:lytic murein transglycosylase n=1 Tax=unclassified Brevundimonas TaxID=2622653 RepID=UPI0006F3DC0B|nr:MULTISPECIES: lytic murein transglycosylase [unclassified Brevundimonas]KQY84443.1 lytic murein transglycosylase [Brevundimonas sp. Root1423]KRA19768.1 lytic murein transglycosylase [Brevundimonas sp. Root608]